jgi:hypothetical protein
VSVFSDAWTETEAKKRGAPIGPRVRPIVRFDDEGRYTVWPDKACSVCGLGLTSRNRYGASTMCREHGREHERNRVRKPRAVSLRQASTVTPVSKVGAKDSDTGSLAAPRSEVISGLDIDARLHAALSTWLCNPDAEYAADLLQSALDDYELRHRLRRLLPAEASGIATPSTPTAVPCVKQARRPVSRPKK